VTTRYWKGFPVGFIGKDGHVYVNNHVNIEIMYHPSDTETDKYHIVRFIVEPFSIKHDFYPLMDDTNDIDDTHVLMQVAKINNPIESCAPKAKIHTTYNMITQSGREPQRASGQVLFTYDVKWELNAEVKWASRWDIYLNMDNAVPAKVHWLSIANSLGIVFVLSAMIAATLIHNVPRDIARYNRLATDEETAEGLKEYGWKFVHADVFRPPTFSPLLLAVACGTGAQLLAMTFLTIAFSAMGFISPERRGYLLMAELLLFVCMGGLAGYVTARLYKTFKGKSRQKATTLTAVGFPGICFGVFIIMNIIALVKQSTYVVPFVTMLSLVVLWFGISIPLVFFGAYFGYRHEAIEFPVTTSSIPRQIPNQPWFMGIPFTMVIAGILPFGSCFVELYYILASVWMDYYNYVFGFLFLVFVILIITCAEITLLFTYFQLRSEDYHCWWRSFANAGSTSVYVFLYSILFFQQLEANLLASYFLYFGYIGLSCLGLFCMMGFVGMSTSLWFNKVIFRPSKSN
jgi:transmembrane 9 superfamily protein 2/4